MKDSIADQVETNSSSWVIDGARERMKTLAWRNTRRRRGIETTHGGAGNGRWLELPALRVPYRARPTSVDKQQVLVRNIDITRTTRTEACQSINQSIYQPVNASLTRLHSIRQNIQTRKMSTIPVSSQLHLPPQLPWLQTAYKLCQTTDRLHLRKSARHGTSVARKQFSTDQDGWLCKV